MNKKPKALTADAEQQLREGLEQLTHDTFGPDADYIFVCPNNALYMSSIQPRDGVLTMLSIAQSFLANYYVRPEYDDKGNMINTEELKDIVNQFREDKEVN
jgi:hypothetical protein